MLPCLSPAATSASNAKFLPPLTTFAERNTPIVEDSTPRSSSRSRKRSVISSSRIFAPGCLMPDACCLMPQLEFQTGFARRIRQRLHPAVITVTVPVERHLRDALRDRLGRDGLADLGGGVLVAAMLALRPGVFLDRAGRHHDLAG